VRAAAGVMAAAEVRELPAFGGGDEQLAGVRIRERCSNAVRRVGMLERLDTPVGPVATDDDVASVRT